MYDEIAMDPTPATLRRYWQRRPRLYPGDPWHLSGHLPDDRYRQLCREYNVDNPDAPDGLERLLAAWNASQCAALSNPNQLPYWQYSLTNPEEET